MTTKNVLYVPQTATESKVLRDASLFAFVDVEVGMKDHRVHDIGILRWDDAQYHAADRLEAIRFVRDVHFLCGHNLVHHDAKYLLGEEQKKWVLVDTLYMSPLLFPGRYSHKLPKDEKLIDVEFNNPLSDCQKAHDLLMNEQAQWALLSEDMRLIYASLLKGQLEFEGFLLWIGATYCPKEELEERITTVFEGKICQHAPLADIITHKPVELAYALALTGIDDGDGTTPGWVLYQYPDVEYVVHQLRHTICEDGCDYCRRHMDIHHNLKRFFGYEGFRTYGGEPLQENAVRAAVAGESLLAIFPTGGGKSLTFQLPALMEARNVRGLTVVISPLQSLMKDQVDNLATRGIHDAVTINGMLDPLTRAQSIELVQNGVVSLLYISPEMLRSKTIERILLARHVVRFVIDEAHCFSAWGQDFRVDYLYIATFIATYQKQKRMSHPIPVSCFTATAKQKVIQDICDYFKQSLNIHLQLFASSAGRTNLRYSVIHSNDDDEKYQQLRGLLTQSDCPTIIYVSRTKRTKELAAKLSRDGMLALPFNGKMKSDEKVAHQEAFMNDEVRIIVATSAFGMGVDKSDVGLVIHYDISDSLENYVQEAGRAGRDPHLEARCYVLYSDSDLDKHFILLNQTKLSISEIQQVWKAIKELTRGRVRISKSALEIARQAGWDDSVSDIETRVRAAISALEQAGYVERGNNVPHVYATGITVTNMDEARRRITNSLLFEKQEVETAARIIKHLITQKNIYKAQDAEAESRIDYLADILGLTKEEVVSATLRMRQEGILADSRDISAYLQDMGESETKSRRLLERFMKLERYVLEHVGDEPLSISCKQLNDDAHHGGITTATERDIRTLLNFLAVNRYADKYEDGQHNISIRLHAGLEATLKRFERRMLICQHTIEWLYKQTVKENNDDMKERGLSFSVVELLEYIKRTGGDFFDNMNDVQLHDVEEALIYLSKIGAMKLEGGFLVLYNAMDIKRLKDNKMRYKMDDYKLLNEFYKQKIQQVHIVGEYANLMVRDYNAALRYVQDYFQLDYKRFVQKYFQGERATQIDRNITPEKYNQIFGGLSDRQMEIISDSVSRCIVVAAGPGSGKTRVLVHKLASLLLLEDVKHEQLLMLTFSRAAATEFKQKLMSLIGNAAHFVEITTFHSYCFNLLGRIGNLEDATDVVKQAASMIGMGEVEPSRISKTVLVIDEAQDMSADEYDLVRALMTVNEEMRVIAVGDDDQNIYEFRGSDSRHMSQLLSIAGGRFVEMTDNYRSCPQVVAFANSLVPSIAYRMKSIPIRSVNNVEGVVQLTHHASPIMYQSVVKEMQRNGIVGSTAILTQTNEEALMLVAMLRRAGLSAKLIQSMDGFKFYNLAEVRMFIKCIKAETSTPTIADEVWEKAKQAVFRTYATSACLPYFKRCTELFVQTHRTKYLTDLTEFLFESSTEDFCEVTTTDIVVSTIHKAKGREFDDVYLLITMPHHLTDRERRCYYVGITRAKRRLFIHTNGALFNPNTATTYLTDPTIYEMPSEVVLQLSHRDVNLGFFKEHKSNILALRAGQPLRFAHNFLYNGNCCVAQLSQKMQTDLAQWNAKGYDVAETSVRFVVAWRPKDASPDEPEHAVLLADMVLRKMDGVYSQILPSS